MEPAVLVMAAGVGSRYGGLKQIDPVGPAGETLLDYSLFDARRAGFGRIVDKQTEAGAARQGFEPHGAGAGEKIEDAGTVDREAFDAMRQDVEN